jgi:ubiquinone/menaquinone biosynthesis C-methylase UbiE
MDSIRDRLSGFASWLEHRALSAYWHARAPHVLPALNLQPTDELLEIGGGIGTWTSYIAPRVKSLTTTEIDDPLIARSRLWRSPTNPVRPTATVNYMHDDAQAMQFADASFDVIAMTDVIEHIPDDALALKESARVLRPGGRIVITTMRADRPSYGHRIVWEHEREYSEERLRLIVTDAGLTLTRVFSFYHAPMMLARELQMWSESHSWGKPFPMRMASAALLMPLVLFERILPIGRPAGIGVVATKP